MMQVNSQERENIETTILALVLSQKRGCSLPQLCKDYYEMEGEQIPWKRLGYTSLLKLLQSMSKTIVLENRNNVVFLKGIATDKSKHVSKLVAGQKDQKHLIGRKTYKPSHYYPNTPPVKIHIPAEILSMIIHMVNEYPDGVNKDFIFQKVQMHMPYVQITMSEMEEQLHMLSHKIYLSSNKVFPILNQSEILHSEPPIVIASGDEDLNNVYDHMDNDEDDFQFMSSTCMPTLSLAKSVTQSKATSSFIKETVSEWQDQNVEDEFDTLVSKVGTDENNAHNLYNCNHNIDIHTEYSNNNNNNNNNNNSNNNNNMDKESQLDKRYTEDLINERVKFRLEKLIQNNPNGIWCAELPEKYLEEYKVCLNYTELGFSSVREFASQLPEIFHCIQSENTGDFMLYYAKRDIPSNDSREKLKTVNLAELHQIYETDEDEALPTILSLNTCNQLIPDNIVSIGESVGQLNVTDLANDDKICIEVVVVEVFTPAFFWIQLRKKQNTFKLFMKELHNFYVTNHQDYVIPPVVLEKGLNCACIYNGIWHRGIIKTVKPDLQVTIMFYDYGTLKTYPPNAVYYLHRMFSLLPAQAIPCGLYNTRPYKSSKWTRNATHQFAVRTSNIPLIAMVATINAEDNSMMVTLTDTIEEEDVHINDWLVEHKLAEHGKMGEKVDMHNLLLYVEENLIFLPDQCYEKETNQFNLNEKSTEKTCDDALLISPQSTLESKISDAALLISPQSTLEDNLVKLSLQHKSPNDLQKLEENLKSQSSKNDPFVHFTPSKRNTNPFIQDEPIYDANKDEVLPQKLLQLWNENLKLQIQISAIFEILFTKVMKNSDTKINTTPMNNTLNIKDTISQMSDNTNTIATNRVNLAQESLNNNLNFSDYTDFLEYSIKKLNSIYSKIFIPANNVLDIVHQSLPYEEISANKNVPPGFEQIFSMKTSLPESVEKPINLDTPLKETNPFKIGLLNKLQVSDSQEENCFNFDELSISNKNQKSPITNDLMTSEEDNTIILGMNHDAEKVCEEVTFNYHQCYPNCDLGNVDNANAKLPLLNTKFVSTDYVKTSDNIIKNTENVITDSPLTVHNVNEFNTKKHVELMNGDAFNFQNCSNGAYVYTPSHVKLFSQENVLEPKKEENILKHPLLQLENSNIDPTSNNGNINNHITTSWLPMNSFALSLPTMQNNNYSDEGYITRSSTSLSLDRVSPLAQTSNNVNQYSASSHIWNTSVANKNPIQSTTWNKICSQSMKNEDIKIKCNKNQLQNDIKNLSTNDIVEYLDATDNVDTKNVCADSSKLKSIWDKTVASESTYFSKNYSIPVHTSVNSKIYFQVIELPKKLMHLFHYQNEGWLLLNEFLLFTEYKTVSCMLHVLELLHVQVPLLNVDRTQCSIECLELRSNLKQETKDIMYSNTNFQLISIKVALKLLNKFKIISSHELNEVLMNNRFVSGSIAHEIWLIIYAYGQLKRTIESRGKL